MTIKSKCAYAFHFVWALILNAFIEWHNRRLENKRREWKAVKTGGGGLVPLGRLSQSEAIDKTAKFGSIDYVDTEVAIVMYSDVFKP